MASKTEKLTELTPVTYDQVVEADASIQHDFAVEHKEPWGEICPKTEQYLQSTVDVAGVEGAIATAFLLGRRAQAIADGTWEHPSKEEIEEMKQLRARATSEVVDSKDAEGAGDFDDLMRALGLL